MSTARLAQLFKEQTKRKIRSFDSNSDVAITGFKGSRLDSADVADIIEGLRYLSHQPRLLVDLSDTQLSDAEIKSIAQWLQSSDTPQHVILKLQNTQFSDEAAKALSEAAISAKAPENLEIDLDGSQLSEAGKNLISGALLKISQEKSGKHVKFSIAPTLFEVHQGKEAAQEDTQATSSKYGRCALL